MILGAAEAASAKVKVGWHLYFLAVLRSEVHLL